MTAHAEETVIAVARLTRQRCICQEEAEAAPCDCRAPVTREQIGRLRAYLALHADRAVAYSELASGWPTALHAFLPDSDDPLEAWLNSPFDVPEAAELCHAADLGMLLDMLGAPPLAIMC